VFGRVPVTRYPDRAALRVIIIGSQTDGQRKFPVRGLSTPQCEPIPLNDFRFRFAVSTATRQSLAPSGLYGEAEEMPPNKRSGIQKV
jgi:hypothetical protein